MVVLCLAGCGQGLGPDQQGKEVTADSLKGQWLIINYWAEWCGPCRREIPALNTLAARLGSEGVQVLGVNFDQLHGERLATAAQAMGIAYRVLAEDPADTLHLPAAEGLPVTFVLDPTRQVRATLLGEQTAASLTQTLATLRGQQAGQ
jgi:thiol-disulfide isomerase/thioredoxin